MKRIWRFLIFVCLLCSEAVAQNAQLSGLVKDKTGAVVPHAKVLLTNVDTASVMNARTDKAGFFLYASVQPGRYDLSAEASGFDKTVMTGMKLDTAANVSQDLILRVKTSSEEVTVTQQAGQLNTDDGTVSTVVDRTQIANMPLNGNDLTTLFELSPGTLLNAGGSGQSNGGGFSVDGQRPTANYLTIDGASGEAYVPSYTGVNNSGAGIATSASGGTNGILPVDAIEEYRMDTSTYTAENGRTPGGQIQVRTRSGTNKFHGTLFEEFRNQVLDANDWFANYTNVKQSQLRMNEFGGTLGGPILRNRLFFFIANDNLVLDQPNTVTQNYVPDASIIESAYPTYKTWLSVYPSGNGGSVSGTPSFDYFSDSYPYLIRNHTTSVRMDWQLPRSIHTFFRANIAPSSSLLYSLAGKGSRVNINSYTGGITVPFGSHSVDDLTVNHTSDNTTLTNFVGSIGGNSASALQDNLPTGVNPSADYFGFYPYSGTGAGSFVYAGTGANNQLHQWNIVDTFSLQIDRHTLKFGADFLTRQTTEQVNRNEYLLYVLAGTTLPSSPTYTPTALSTGMVTTFYDYHYVAFPIISLSNTSLFANDDWKVNHRLTINFGVRWELNPAPSVGPLGTLTVEGDDLNPATFRASVSNHPLYQTRYDNFAPRFGFAWSPRSNSGTILRGGLGIYFDTGQAGTTAGVSTLTSYPYLYSQTSTNIALASVNFSDLTPNTEAALAEATQYIVDPSLMSPRTYEWSLSLDQEFGRHAKLTTSYVGNDGEKLVGEDRYYNAKNSAGQYPVNTTYVKASGNLYIITNQSHSNYQALQTQLTSKIGQRFSALASYTWGHTEDNGSTDFSSVGAIALNPMAASANDARHMFSAAIHFAPAGFTGSRLVRALTGGWGVDTIVRLQTALPVTVTYSNTSEDNVNQYLSNADVVAGQPAILHEHTNGGTIVPGNKLLNWAAFTPPPTDSSGNQLRNGDSPTNGYRLFGLNQWDLAASRSWNIREGLSLNFRVDTFNVLNTANFSDVTNGWTVSGANTFGRSAATYANTFGATASSFGESGAQLNVFQNGGPRELQLSLKLKF